MDDVRGLGGRFWALLVAAFALPRLALLWLSYGDPFDIKSYALVEWVGRHGNALYGDPALAGRYPYLPGWALVLHGLGIVGRPLGGDPWMFMKLPGLLAEAGIVWMILDWKGSDGVLVAAGRRRAAAFAYALSPVSWMVTAGHGQFDAVVLFFILGSARAWGKLGLRAALSAGLWMGAALCFKQWPLFLAPIFFRNAEDRRAGFGFACAACAVPLLLLSPYLVREGPAAVWGHLSYTGVSNVSLGEALKPLFARLAVGGNQGSQVWETAMLLCLFLLWASAWLEKRRDLGQGLPMMILGFLVFAPNLAAQYILWPLPYLALMDPTVAWRYSVAATTLLLFFYAEFDPKALDMALSGSLVRLGSGLMLGWAFLNFGFWTYTAWEWVRLRAKSGQPSDF